MVYFLLNLDPNWKCQFRVVKTAKILWEKWFPGIFVKNVISFAKKNLFRVSENPEILPTTKLTRAQKNPQNNNFLTAPAGPNCPGPNLLGDAIASKKEQLLCKVIHYLANDKWNQLEPITQVECLSLRLWINDSSIVSASFSVCRAKVQRDTTQLVHWMFVVDKGILPGNPAPPPTQTHAKRMEGSPVDPSIHFAWVCVGGENK